MKAIITKQDVAKAVETLNSAGKKTTIQAIYSALGSKGSLSTVVKLKAELAADALIDRDSEQGLKAFRELWALAVEEGRKQKDSETRELRDALDAVAAESQKLDGEVTVAKERVAELEQQRERMLVELATSHEQVTTARTTGEQHAGKAAESWERIAKMQEAHAKEVSDLRQQLADAQKVAHTVELKLARAEARLEK